MEEAGGFFGAVFLEKAKGGVDEREAKDKEGVEVFAEGEGERRGAEQKVNKGIVELAQEELSNG